MTTIHAEACEIVAACWFSTPVERLENDLVATVIRSRRLQTIIQRQILRVAGSPTPQRRSRLAVWVLGLDIIEAEEDDLWSQLWDAYAADRRGLEVLGCRIYGGVFSG